MRRRRSRCRITVARTLILRQEGPDSRWSTDFMHDQLANGRRFRVLRINDAVTSECLAAVPETSLSGKRIVREMSALIARRGRPGAVVGGRRRRRHRFKHRWPRHCVHLIGGPGLHSGGWARLARHRAGQANPRHTFARSFQGRMRK